MEQFLLFKVSSIVLSSSCFLIGHLKAEHLPVIHVEVDVACLGSKRCLTERGFYHLYLNLILLQVSVT